MAMLIFGDGFKSTGEMMIIGAADDEEEW